MAGFCCFFVPRLSTVLTGDTLLNGGRAKLFALPADTRLLTGHGDATTITVEREALSNA